LRKELRSKASENVVLRRLFGSRRDEVTREWRKLYTEEFNDLYCSPSGDQIEKNEIGEACSTYGGRRDIYRILVEKPEGKRPLGIFRRRWEDNIKIYLQKVGCWSMDWIDLARD
jgi:hypothetical protein